MHSSDALHSPAFHTLKDTNEFVPYKVSIKAPEGRSNKMEWTIVEVMETLVH